MVFNTTFNIISVLLVEENGVPQKKHWPATGHWQTVSHNVLSSTPPYEWIRTHNFNGHRHWMHR